MNEKGKNPFAKMDSIKKEKAKKFLEEASGETNKATRIKKNRKAKHILLDINLSDRLEKFLKEEAKRYESQNYIFNQAVNEWLEKRGF
ncbi:hypothetical protein FQW77_08485 [Campylobacter jejuni]|nr:hypothetical protein [Campylobacter jejuni]